MAVRARLTAAEGRRFAFTVGLAFVAVGGISWWRGHEIVPEVLWAVGGVLLLAGAIVPTRLSRIHGWWMALGHAISKVVQPIVIGAMYFVVITPTAVMLRALGRNPMEHPERDDSYWMPAASGGRSDLETQF